MNKIKLTERLEHLRCEAMKQVGEMKYVITINSTCTEPGCGTYNYSFNVSNSFEDYLLSLACANHTFNLTGEETIFTSELSPTGILTGYISDIYITDTVEERCPICEHKHIIDTKKATMSREDYLELMEDYFLDDDYDLLF